MSLEITPHLLILVVLKISSLMTLAVYVRCGASIEIPNYCSLTMDSFD